MLDLISMWKNPKMIAYFALTAVLYALLLLPVSEYSLFAQDADYLRIAMCIPVGFSFLFGPAAAWGAAFGNLAFDALTGLSWVTPFGFLGNFLIGYIPYKLYSKITTEKPIPYSAKKLGLFIGLSALACALCGLVIGWGLFYVRSIPFAMTAFTIFTSDFLWAALLGPIVLLLSYGFFSKRHLLYNDLLDLQPSTSWNRTNSLAIAIFGVSAALCFVITILFTADVWLLLPFIVVSLVSVALACR
jgi:energy-coupling factor transport system substrate-specific component